jgi:hypothetical protein
MIESQATKDKKEQLAKNLGTLYQGLNGTGHRDLPKPLPEGKYEPKAPNKQQKSNGSFLVPFYLGTMK